MKYKKHHPSQDLANALSLDKSQVIRIQKACAKAYHDLPISSDFSIDEVNALVAPYIKSPEEAFYAASVIITDVLEANAAAGKRNWTDGPQSEGSL